ncbi:MAG TPA: adenylosuccinate lyase, partial [Alphaproteobacteria bacterium]
LNSLGGLVYSQRVLLALTQSGVAREDAYRIVQRNAMDVWDSDGKKSFADLLKADKDVAKKLKAKDIDALFDPSWYTKQVDKIFKGVFGK